MPKSRVTFLEAERDAIVAADPVLKVHVLLAGRALELVGDAAQKAVGPPAARLPPARRVTSLLMAQLSNHLRCAILLSVRGYSAQACVLTASVYEAAFAIMAIGTDDKAARSWLTHKNPNRSFQDVKKLTLAGLRNVTALDRKTAQSKADISRAVERNYVVYRQLCWAKHLNPLFVQQHGRRDSERQRIVFFNGPDTTAQSVKVTCFAL